MSIRNYTIPHYKVAKMLHAGWIKPHLLTFSVDRNNVVVDACISRTIQVTGTSYDLEKLLQYTHNSMDRYEG